MSVMPSALAGSFFSAALLAMPVDAEQRSDKISINKHIAIVVDGSDSVLPPQTLELMKGMAAGLLSPEANAYFTSGLCYAFSTIHFAGIAKKTSTEIVCNPQEAKIFAQNNFWNDQTHTMPDIPDFNYYIGTDIGRALTEVANTFKQEEAIGLVVEARAVLIVGDGENNATNGSPALIGLNIARDFGATISGVAIGENAINATTDANEMLELLAYYKDNVCTPADVQTHDGIRVPKGACIGINSFGEMKPAVIQALNVVLF